MSSANIGKLLSSGERKSFSEIKNPFAYHKPVEYLPDSSCSAVSLHSYTPGNTLRITFATA